jgi:nucleoside-diphosphate-sugar epimerase
VILVTGGTGFVGRHLVDALLARGEAVRVLTRGTAPSQRRAGLEVAVGKFEDAESLQRAARGANIVVHLAASLPLPGVTDAALHDFNVAATKAIADAARDNGVALFVHCSSGGVYGDGLSAAPHKESDPPHPETAYERSKLAAERAVVQSLSDTGVSWCILRPAGVYGAGRTATAAFFAEVRRRRLWVHATPNVIVHPTHVSDVVQVCVRLLDAADVRERVVNVAGQRAMRLQDYVALTASVLGVRAPQLVVPAFLGNPVARATGAAMRAARLSAPRVIDRAGRAYINRSLDTSLARQLLGFDPVDLISALRSTADAIAGAPRSATA